MVKNDSNYDERLAQLLSEYLDGQLSPDQAEKVERRLAEDPQARRLLAEIKQVSQMVRQLPRVSAPEDMAEQIQSQLEREVLLGADVPQYESAGRKRLPLRRWLAAAAMLMLTGAVVLIVYSVLIGPLPPFGEPEETGTPSPLAALPETQLEPQITESEPEDVTQSRPQFSLVHLEITSNNLTGDQDQLEKLLAELDIQQVDRTHPNTQQAEFAFNCRSEQLQYIFQTLKADPNQQIDLVLVDNLTGSQTTVEKVSELQVMTLARQPDPDKRNVIAKAILDNSFTPTSNPKDMPEQLREIILETQPPLDLQMRLLGVSSAALEDTTGDPNLVVQPSVVTEPNALIRELPTVTTEQPSLMVEVIFTLKSKSESLKQAPSIK